MLTSQCYSCNQSTENNLHTNNKAKQEIDYLISGPGTEVNRVARAEITLKMYDELSAVYTGIGYFKGIYSLQFKDDANPYQMPTSCVSYGLQEPFKVELEKL